VAGNEPVTSPDQHKQPNLRLVRTAAVVCALVILTLWFGNHKGGVEQVWIGAIAAGMLLMVIVDWMLRRNGLRS
jgi:hypothetical protein